MNLRAALLNLATVAVSVLVGLVLVEAGYRLYLWSVTPAPQPVAADGPAPSYSFYNRSHWEYDRALGYRYPAGRKLLHGSVTNGRLSTCDEIDTINERGNIGPIRGDYDSAELKILLFGDSFPAFITDGETFPSRLQAVLQDRAGVDAHIVNFGRDGTGILQMFDLAAAKVPEWRPDLVIITFISDDLDRVRIWRTATEIDGEPRILVTDRPDPRPSLDWAADAFVLFPDASPEWCEATLAAGGMAPELAALNERYLRMQARAGRDRPDYLTLRHSFVLGRVLSGNPFQEVVRRTGRAWSLPRVAFRDYRDDPGFVAALERLRDSGVPLILIHLPIAPELMEGQPMLLGFQEELWRSLEAATGQRSYRLAEHIVPPLDDPLAMSHQPTDHHPSPFGMQVYANAITRILAEEGILAEVPEGLDQRPPAADPDASGVVLVRSDLRCPFRLVRDGADASAWEWPLWQIFRHYRPPPPLRIDATSLSSADAGPGGDEPPGCSFDLLEVPAGPVPDLDWRIGHNLFFGDDFWDRELTFRLRLRATAPIAFSTAALVIADGHQEARTPIAALDAQWRTFAVSLPVQPQTTTLRLWLQFTHEGPIEGTGRVEMSAAEALLSAAPPPGDQSE